MHEAFFFVARTGALPSSGTGCQRVRRRGWLGSASVGRCGPPECQFGAGHEDLAVTAQDIVGSGSDESSSAGSAIDGDRRRTA